MRKKNGVEKKRRKSWYR